MGQGPRVRELVGLTPVEKVLSGMKEAVCFSMCPGFVNWSVTLFHGLG